MEGESGEVGWWDPFLCGAIFVEGEEGLISLFCLSICQPSSSHGLSSEWVLLQPWGYRNRKECRKALYSMHRMVGYTPLFLWLLVIRKHWIICKHFFPE